MPAARRAARRQHRPVPAAGRPAADRAGRPVRRGLARPGRRGRPAPPADAGPRRPPAHARPPGRVPVGRERRRRPAGGHVHHAADAAAARPARRPSSARRPPCSPSAVCDEVGLRAPAAAPAVVAGAAFVVAETGQVCLASDDPAGRGRARRACWSAWPGLESVVPRTADLAVMLKLLARSATGRPMPAYTALVGPAPRPGFHLVLLDNGRTDLLAGEHRPVLRCIGCGACTRACPVYRSADVAPGRAVGGPDRGAPCCRCSRPATRPSCRTRRPCAGRARRLPRPRRPARPPDRPAVRRRPGSRSACGCGGGPCCRRAVPVGDAAGRRRVGDPPAGRRPAPVVPRPVAGAADDPAVDRVAPHASTAAARPAAAAPRCTSRRPGWSTPTWACPTCSPTPPPPAAGGGWSTSRTWPTPWPRTAAAGRRGRRGRRPCSARSVWPRRCVGRDLSAGPGGPGVALVAGCDAAVAETGSLVFRGGLPAGWRPPPRAWSCVEPRTSCPTCSTCWPAPRRADPDLRPGRRAGVRAALTPPRSRSPSGFPQAEPGTSGSPVATDHAAPAAPRPHPRLPPRRHLVEPQAGPQPPPLAAGVVLGRVDQAGQRVGRRRSA